MQNLPYLREGINSVKVLVTGASGFVGSHLCERLEQLGHKVYAQARDSAKLKNLKVPGVHVTGKLFHDRRHEWIDHLPPDIEAVVHVAGLVHSFDCEDFFLVNALATERIVKDFSQKYEHLKFILISSLASVGPSKNSLLRREEHRPNPISAYGRSKLKAERLFIQAAPVQWNKIIVRPPIVIGPRDEGLLEIFRLVRKGIVPMMGIGGGKREYSYVCIYDLIEVIHNFLNHSFEHNETFFVSYPAPATFEEIIRVIAQKMKVGMPFLIPCPSSAMKLSANILKTIHRIRPLNIRLTPDKCRELAGISWTCSSEKSQKIPSVQYNWNLEEAIEATFQDYQKRGKL